MNQPVLELHDVHRRFGDQPVLRGVSLRVVPGQVYALLGRNGAGKTTAMRCLLGLLSPHRGQARVLGHDAAELPAAARARAGYVSEEHRLYPFRTVAQTVQFETSTNPRIDHCQLAGRVAELGLPGRKRIKYLSRGERAQLALTIALASDPEVLVFDDPALGLDAVVRRELLERVIDSISDGDVGMLLSTHDLPSAERLADRVGILHEGRIVWERDADAIKRRVLRWCVRGVEREGLLGMAGVLAISTGPAVLEVLTDGVDAPGFAAALREAGAQTSEPMTASLEEIFVAITNDQARAETVIPAEKVEV